MPATKTQLIGGAFQDAEGNVLAAGYLTLRLNADGNVASVGNVCAGIEIRIQLDSNGNVASASSTPTAPNQFIWANDVISPINSFYRVTGYAENGQVSFGPNNQQVVSGGVGGGTFDVGTWVPNTVISWNPSPQPLELEVNSVPFSSQTLQNIEDSATVTWTDAGGGVLKATASGSSVPAGTNIVPGLPFCLYYRGSSSSLGTSGFTYAQLISANAVAVFPTHWRVSMEVTVGLNSPIAELVLIRTLRDSLITVDITTITFGGNPTPTWSSPGTKVSDIIALPIDAAHDYFFGFTGNAFGGTGNIASSDAINSEGVTFNGIAGNPNNGGTPLSTTWNVSVPPSGSAFPLGQGPFFITSWQAA